MGFLVPAGLPLVASYRFGSSLANSPILGLPACEMLQIQVNVAGYGSGGGIASLRFGLSTSAVDSTAGNYSTSLFTGSTAAPSAPTNTLGTFAGVKLGANSVTVQRNAFVTVYDVSGASHLCTVQSGTHAAATAASVSSWGTGNYTGSGQILSIQLVVDTGVTMPAGTSIYVFGGTPS